ncbi:hypothetical protein CEXT_417201 [Caerostris extrusa]|uniref:Ribosomal protein S3 n=1 Tax=Caerostris extrusa TaxID=172846 RepID=A0AAV4QJ55_CAEEX|nr:hypothetical protein CEXT_417201 [Caerostris extrusa]
MQRQRQHPVVFPEGSLDDKVVFAKQKINLHWSEASRELRTVGYRCVLLIGEFSALRLWLLHKPNKLVDQLQHRLLVGSKEEIFRRGKKSQICGREFRRDGIQSRGKGYDRRTRSIEEVRGLHCSYGNMFEAPIR